MTLKIGEIHTKGATVTPSVCPYCSVGCATIIHTKGGWIVNIEGDPKSPHNEGALCPKGAAIYQLHVNPNRETRVLHRKPGAREWEEVELGWAWPVNRRVLYNRASADPNGRPWSERKKWVWWENGKWRGMDVPDFPVDKPPGVSADSKRRGIDAHSGGAPFIMKPDGVGWLFVPAGLVDGPLPTHYEPAESPLNNPFYGQQTNPVLKYWDRKDNLLAAVCDDRYPYVITTYRLTEHYLAGAMSRWNPWLTELMPELFIELSPELAGEKGIQSKDWVGITTARGRIRARALVTSRLRPLKIGGRIVHQVGMPFRSDSSHHPLKIARKCTLCHDRISEGLEPACSQACPTDSIRFGPVNELIGKADARIRQLHEQGEAGAYLYGADETLAGGLNAFYLLVDHPRIYGLPESIDLWK